MCTSYTNYQTQSQPSARQAGKSTTHNFKKEIYLLINRSFNVQIYNKCLMYLQLLLNFAILTTLVNLVNIVSTTNKDIQVTMQNSPTSGLKLQAQNNVLSADRQERRMLE
jgi:hypothetical protein